MKRKLPWLILVVAGAVLALVLTHQRPTSLVLTGIVTTDSVIVSSELQGRLQQLLVREGDAVKQGQLLGVIRPKEWQAELTFFERSEQQSAAQVTQAEADLKYQSALTHDQTQQAEANLAAARAQVTQAEAEAENARLNFEREQKLFRSGADSAQAFDQARTASDAAQARLESLRKQVQAAQAAVSLAKANADQVAARRALLTAAQHQLEAASAQKEKAKVRYDYTEIRAPCDGIVDVRAALPGEVVNAGQAIVTLINPDNLWVRADVEEGWIDRIRLGDRLNVRLASGAERVGTVYYRAVDADFATQRDVSRTKRDVKTFEIRLRCDNHDRRLAVGMTAYVLVPVK